MNVKLVITDETKWVSYGRCTVKKVYGANNTQTDRYIQFHSALTVATGAVPAVAALYAPAAAPFMWDFVTGIPLSELLVAISSTQIDYTAVVDSGLDMTVDVETDHIVGSNTTLIGDLTTGVDLLTLWTEAAGTTAPKRLLRLDVKNNSSVVAYAFVCALTSAANENGFIVSGPHKMGVGETINLSFGRHGLVPMELNPGSVPRQGCMIECGPNPTLTDLQLASDYNIRAVYDV